MSSHYLILISWHFLKASNNIFVDYFDGLTVAAKKGTSWNVLKVKHEDFLNFADGGNPLVEIFLQEFFIFQIPGNINNTNIIYFAVTILNFNHPFF